jgi:hypothetical protein
LYGVLDYDSTFLEAHYAQLKNVVLNQKNFSRLHIREKINKNVMHLDKIFEEIEYEFD